MEAKTPLYQAHVDLQGKMVPFAGYLLPVEYPTGMMTEHMAVRTACGLFDVSHMGEIALTGPGALASLNHLMANDFTSLAVGRVRYTPMCSENGGVIDDMIVYRTGEEGYLVVVNASNAAKDDAHMRANLLPGTKMENLSVSVGQLALQGPKSTQILAKLVPEEQIPAKYYSFRADAAIGGMPCLISQTGYTGELGYEIYCGAQDTPRIWSLLLDAGREEGLIPCGLGARDTLRLEASMPLYGHEMDETISPLETGLDFGVKLKKPEFIGKAALEAQGRSPRTRVGLKAVGRGILREHQAVFRNGEQVGVTTSGTYCAYLGGSYAMALVQNGALSEGDGVEVEVRSRRVAAEVVRLPFYQRS